MSRLCTDGQTNGNVKVEQCSALAESTMISFLDSIPGTVSAVSLAALPYPPRSTMESGREGGVHAV